MQETKNQLVQRAQNSINGHAKKTHIKHGAVHDTYAEDLGDQCLITMVTKSASHGKMAASCHQFLR